MITMEQLLEMCDPLYDLSDKELEILETVRSLIHRKIEHVQQNKRLKERYLESIKWYAPFRKEIEEG